LRIGLRYPKPMKQYAVLLLAFFSLAFAQSRTLETAKTLYAKGDFKGAVEIAEDIQTAPAQAFAARANSTYAQTVPENRQEALYVQSEKYARKAVELDSKNADAYFEVARALGRLSQIRGVLAALSQGLGTQIRENLENALTADPKHADSWVAYGLWHAEIVGKGVGWLYGASPEAAIANFERGNKLEPKSIIAKVEYAHGLVLIDKKKHLQKAIALLEEAVKIKPEDAAQGLDLARAKRDLDELR
jgi:tetratricopeptide (TPR) repeat protein